MDSTRVRRMLLVLAAALVAGVVESDFEQDKRECASQLVGVLSPCLPYAGGESKAPTLDCCSGLKQVIAKSRKCLCLLIKDRDEPNLGIKVNISLVAHLPVSCKSPTNISECVGLLHLNPNSTDARKFDGLDEFVANVNNGSSTTTTTPSSAADGGGRAASAASGGGATVGGGGSNENQKSNVESKKKKKRGWVAVTAVGVSITGFSFSFF